MQKKSSIILMLAMWLMAASVCAQNQAIKDSIANRIPRGEQVFRWGYSELQTDEERALYDTIMGSLVRFDANNFSPYYFHRCDLTGVPNTMNIQQVIAWLSRLSHDVPELYILSSTIPRYDVNVYYARIGYVNTPERYLSELQRLQGIADTLLAGIQPGMSDYEKLVEIHDRFIEWGDYGDLTGADAGNIRGALINKRAVCEGFARAGLFLCQKAGIPCIFVTGQLQTSTVSDTWGNHAWNFVQLDGQWYLMDLTSDGGFPGIVGHDAFLRGQSYFDEHYRYGAPGSANPNLNGIYQSLPALAAEDYTPGATSVRSTAAGSAPEKVLIDGKLYLRTSKGVFSATGQRVL